MPAPVSGLSCRWPIAAAWVYIGKQGGEGQTGAGAEPYEGPQGRRMGPDPRQMGPPGRRRQQPRETMSEPQSPFSPPSSSRRNGGRRMRGFEQAGSLLQRRVRAVGEGRGFAVAQVLTRWDEIAGPELARMARPVKISYAARGMGATLVLLAPGALAPLVEMAREKLRERVNACYGYHAVSRIRITQTAAAGFAEAQAGFAGAPAPLPAEAEAEAETEGGTGSGAVRAEARRLAAGIGDAGLRGLLEEMGQGILSRQRARK